MYKLVKMIYNRVMEEEKNRLDFKENLLDCDSAFSLT